MREMLLDAGTGYGKQLLGLLVEEIRVAPGGHHFREYGGAESGGL